MSRQCLSCKGRLWCGLPSCPLLEKLRVEAPIARKALMSVFGPSPPNAFVGWQGYPSVQVGPLVAIEEGMDARLYDSPAEWYGLPYADIIRFRSSLARGMRRQRVSESSAMIGEIQSVVMSTKPVDVEARFSKPLSFKMSFSPVSQPMGPTAPLLDLRLAGNPTVPKKVDEFANEKIKVRDALPELLSSGLDYYYVQKVLSAGLLGEKKKLVPTRWAITAADKMIADLYLREIKNFPPVSEFLIFSSDYLYNHFEVLLLPGMWEFEQFEAWSAGTVWTPDGGGISQEYEPYGGRSDYADSEGGGYYAGRFGVTEGLRNMRRQARVVIFREIGQEYQLPVGVFEVRENVRHAFKNPPAKFATLQDAFTELRLRLRNPLEAYLSKSEVLRQKRLSDY
ncbi:hypothetical protein COU36_01525 [Candidatus Micrarchaeota archaeon CG10_big_fil_rev_8_21_14_0_10_59_7]|nr:MAG: hypothetical protein COU36_01525 [Candidatus Micrarchaeota archaeon CG10_big_fil_rev_8_21_14_0_10_59_7]